MLSKIFTQSAGPAPSQAHCRRIGDSKPRTGPAANEAPVRVEPTSDALAAPQLQVANSDPSLPEVLPIRTIADVGSWRAAVPGLVADGDLDRCIVLDREYSSVLILATPEFYASGGHSVLVSRVRAKRLSIEAERVADQAVIAQALAINEGKRRGAVNMVIKDDERNVALYEDLIRGAFKIGATDVHFEMDFAGRTQVRLRLFGRMRPWKTFDTDILLDAVGAGYFGKTKRGTASAASWSAERSLNTITEHSIGGVQVNGRFSTYPVIGGLDVVVRLLKNDPNAAAVPTLSQLGYADSQISSELRLAIGKNSGLIAVVGGTGSGKSTSLKTLMNDLPHKDQLKRFSVEDPVEYVIPGVRQISIQRGADDDAAEVKKKFLSALRMLVRMDPDVVMIGEIRDSETAEIGSEMVQTGHRVLTTVHGDNVIDALSRMTGRLINIPAELMATHNYLGAVMYQKLMPVLCDGCKVPAEEVLEPAVLSLLQEKFSLNTGAMSCASHDGCPACRVEGMQSEGTKGLTVVAEILVPTPAIRETIKTKNWTALEQLWRGSRHAAFDEPDMTGKTAFEHALYKASIGEVDPRDIERDFEAFSSYTIFEGVK